MPAINPQPRPATEAAPAGRSRLEELRELLFGGERQRLDKLSRRLEDPRVRARDLALVLPDSLTVSAHAHPERLKSALQRPVEQCIQESVSRDKKFFADILFPVIGPAIRKSIAEALREFVTSINEAVEHTFSPTGIRWRLEALRTRKTFGEVVLKHTLVYRVDQVFLIENNSGRLMHHASHPDAFSQDSDAVSAMLTAIQDFMQDSFATGEENPLHTVEMGEYLLYLAHGPHATLAGLVRGVAPPELRERFNALLDVLHDRHRGLLMRFDGNRQHLAKLAPMFDDLLLSAARPRRRLTLWKSPALWLVLALVLASGVWLYRDYQQRLTAERLQSAFSGEPGIVLLDVARAGSDFTVSGLADPLARRPEEILAALRLEDVDVRLDFAPYTAAGGQFDLARARRALQVPDSVITRLRPDGVLELAGFAPGEWIERLRSTVLLAPGVSGLDLRALEVDPGELEALRRQQAERERAERGRAAAQRALDEQRRAEAARQREQRLAEQRRAETERLANEARLVALGGELESRVFRFAQGDTLAADDAFVAETGERVAEIMALCERLARDCRIEVFGFTDGIGTDERNAALRAARATAVRERLSQAGNSDEWFSIVDPGPARTGLADPALRKAQLRLAGTGPR